MNSKSPRRSKETQLVHIVTGLRTGGAEMMLYKLLSRSDRTNFNPIVVCLIDAGPMADKIRALGVPVHSLGMGGGIPNPLRLLLLARWLRNWRPAVVQTWMYHADLVGGLAARLARSPSLVWNIRHSDLDPRANKSRTIWTARQCARLSNWLPKRIICCSEASRAVHAELGYNSEKMVVLPNGFDVNAFQANEGVGTACRKELGIPPDAVVVGHVARHDPQKDHKSLLRAASLVANSHPDVHFLLCGDDVTLGNPALRDLVPEALQGRIHLLGRRDDLPRLYPAMDILVSSSSFGEGFPNVIGEAMACQVPCVVTDVGDSAYIVGETGLVVPPSNSPLLADAIEQMLQESQTARKKRGVAARSRIVENFEIGHIVEAYERLYQELADGA